jgi:hypothetical protein
MNSKLTRRGFDEEDYKWFSKEAVLKLKKAHEEVQWLLDRDYKLSSIIELIGGHYQLSARQRTALQRGTSSKLQCEKRSSKLLPYEIAREGCLYIDGFNLIITLEVALSGSVLILGDDGALRDLAGLRGTYKLIDKTDRAVELIGQVLEELKIPQVKFFLDAPVSNSGRLKNRILEHAANWQVNIEVELVSNPDPILSKMDRIVTSDSIILDECKNWFNLSRKIVEDYIKDAWVIKFAQEDNK